MFKISTVLLVAAITINYYLALRYNLQSQLPKETTYNYNPLAKGQPKLATNSYLRKHFPPRNLEQIGKENATMIMLVRNGELEGALSAMRSLEDRFNREYKYPWVFMNDEPFDEEFVEKTSLMASGETYYELVPAEHWQPPPYINKTRLDENLNTSTNVLYGFLRSYRNMCHFYSGFFYKQERLLNGTLELTPMLNTCVIFNTIRSSYFVKTIKYMGLSSPLQSLKIPFQPFGKMSKRLWRNTPTCSIQIMLLTF